MDFNISDKVNHIYYSKKNNNNPKPMLPNQEIKEVEASSSDSLNSYGRAMVNISFKGSKAANEQSDINISDFVYKLVQMGISSEIIDEAKTKFNENQYNKIFSIINDLIIDAFGTSDKIEELDADAIENIQSFITDSKPEDIDLISENFPDIDSNTFSGILSSINATNKNLAERLFTDKELDFNENQIWNILRSIKEENLSFAEKLCTDKELDFPKDKIAKILESTTKENIALAQRLCFDKSLEFPMDLLGGTFGILASVNSENISLAEKLCTDKDLEFPLDILGGWDGVLSAANAENLSLAHRLCTDKELDFPKDKLSGYQGVLSRVNQGNKSLATLMAADENLPAYKDYIYDILYSTNAENVSFVQRLCFDKELDFPKDRIGGYDGILSSTNSDNINLSERLCTDKELGIPLDELTGYFGILNAVNQGNKSLADLMSKDASLSTSKSHIKDILNSANAENISLAERLYADEKINYPKDQLGGYKSVLSYTNSDNASLVNLMAKDNNLAEYSIYIKDILANTNAENINIALDLCIDKNLAFPKDKLASLLKKINKDNKKEIEAFIEQCKTGELPVNSILLYLDKQISQRDLNTITRIMGREKVNSLSESDLYVACKLHGLYGKRDINEIKMINKKAILRALVECNTGMFGISEEIKKDFPLIPTSQEEYCNILPSLVRSLGIETNTLTTEKTQEFNASVFNLADSLINISDEEFNNMNIKQEYSKDEFIADTLDIVKNMEESERQKVYDYFGFELHHNKNNQTGFSISGYPVNLNNGKKLAKITDPNTKEIVEKLRPKVIQFSQHNHISCDNNDIEKYLNEVVNIFPELRTQIGKSQHNTHNFDVMKHSLKVMKKIVENPNYKQLNNSDKKLMLLAALFHDGNKIEGSYKGNHSSESAFDSFYITKKLNLTREEQIKLYTMIKNHEWLHYVNSGKDEADIQKRQQSVAFDLQYDNLFDMSEIFTEADLKSVKYNDSFYNVHENEIINQSSIIKEYITELKKSQPLLPVTKLPKASNIQKAITQVNSDGSTNIKGVYKNDKGLVVIKYNEVEDWEAIGFPKGTISKGIKAKGVSGINNLTECEVDTGNIKFFVHGLDYSNQLSKFDAFALPDSEALLSVSYTERPESKYRFFRTQGVLLDVDTKYVHGGGNTDAGSGCGKDINNFKENYIFGGQRESDRLYVSNLIKEALNLSDDEYADFVQQNANKSMLEITPPETREKIIQSLATINSNTRKGNREYNEMYVSNPNVMGVFAYKMDGNINNVLNFLEDTYDKNGFLQQYALEHDMPFIVFGD